MKRWRWPLAPVHGPTLRRMLRNRTWTLRVVRELVRWLVRCAWRRQRPSVLNVPFSLVCLWPEAPITRDEIERWNEAMRNEFEALDRAAGFNGPLPTPRRRGSTEGDER